MARPKTDEKRKPFKIYLNSIESRTIKELVNSSDAKDFSNWSREILLNGGKTGYRANPIDVIRELGEIKETDRSIAKRIEYLTNQIQKGSLSMEKEDKEEYFSLIRQFLESRKQLIESIQKLYRKA